MVFTYCGYPMSEAKADTLASALKTLLISAVETEGNHVLRKPRMELGIVRETSEGRVHEMGVAVYKCRKEDRLRVILDRDFVREIGARHNSLDFAGRDDDRSVINRWSVHGHYRPGGYGKSFSHAEYSDRATVASQA
jgi:hypothetical protein